MFFVSKHKLVETFQQWAIFWTSLTFFLTLQVHKIKFLKTFSRGHHHIKWLRCEDWHFSTYFLRCILLSQIQNGIYKKCFFVQNKVSWNISTIGHVLRLLTFFLTLEVHEIKFFKTFSHGHHHIKWFFVRTDIFRNIFWDAFCSTKSRVEFIKNVFLFKTQLVEAY